MLFNLIIFPINDRIIFFKFILIIFILKNSQKIILEETTIGEDETNSHFIDHKFDFPPAPKLGIWYAELWYGTNVCHHNVYIFLLSTL